MKGYDVLTGELIEDARFFTQYTRPVLDSDEKVPTKSNVERAYIPPEDQIRDMMASGERLRAARMALYAPEDEVVQEEMPPQLGADLVDVQRQTEALTARLDVQAKAAAQKAAEKKAAAEKAALDAAVEAEIARRAQTPPPAGG